MGRSVFDKGASLFIPRHGQIQDKKYQPGMDCYLLGRRNALAAFMFVADAAFLIIPPWGGCLIVCPETDMYVTGIGVARVS